MRWVQRGIWNARKGKLLCGIFVAVVVVVVVSSQKLCKCQSRSSKIVYSGSSVTMINDKPRPVRFEWRQAMDRAGARLVSETRRHGTKNGDLLWALTLNPGDPAVLRYTLDLPGRGRDRDRSGKRKSPAGFLRRGFAELCWRV